MFSCGIYIFSRDIIEQLAQKQKKIEEKLQNFPNDDIGKMFGANSIVCDFEKDIVNDSIREGRVYCYETDENNEFCHILKGYS